MSRTLLWCCVSDTAGRTPPAWESEGRTDVVCCDMARSDICAVAARTCPTLHTWSLLGSLSPRFSCRNCCVKSHRYAQVMTENPKCPPEVRLGLAACLYRGGKLERAGAAYKRYAFAHLA